MMPQLMGALHEICKQDRKYLKVIAESTLVRSSAGLLKGRGKRSTDKKESSEAKKEEEEEEGREDVLSSKIAIRGKIQLLELMKELAKAGTEMPDEEELMEVVLRLEEEASVRVEEENSEEEGDIDGDREGNMEEKREWEELSERAHEFVWVIEVMKRSRAARDTNMRSELDWIESRKEEEIEKENSLMQKDTSEMEIENYRIGGENRGIAEEINKLKEDNTHLKELCPIVTSLDDAKVTFPQSDGIKREGNRIISSGSGTRTCFIGEVMKSV